MVVAHTVCEITLETWDDILLGHDKVCIDIKGIIWTLLQYYILINNQQFSSISLLKPHPEVFPYVTGFWKTDRNVTLGLFHFIGPANGYTHTLHIHTAIIRLGWLVCFSRVTFADPVNSWLEQWDPWRALHGRHGCEIHPRDAETSITPFKRVWAYDWLFWDS